MPTVAVQVKCPFCGHEFATEIEEAKQPDKPFDPFDPNTTVFKARDYAVINCENAQCAKPIKVFHPKPKSPPAAP